MIVLYILLKVRSVKFEKSDVVEPARLSNFEVLDGVLALFSVIVPLLLVFLPLPNFYISFSFLARRLFVFFAYPYCGLMS
jgi:hypothetical protein